jgi:nucleoside-diphosphate-sugar epimerase
MSGALLLGPLPQRVLVTGAAGYFGGLLARHLAERGIQVVATDRLDDPEPDPRLIEAKADLRFPDQVDTLFKTQGPFDAVFHCAAVMGHENPDPKDLWDSNVRGTAHVGDACLAHGVKKLVYTSTICVYGQGYAHPVAEDEPTCPIEDYGRSKLEGEKELTARAARGLAADAIRCPTIVSAGRLGLLAILFEFVHEGRKVWLAGDGANRYSFVFAGDLAEACLLAARSPGSHVYHVGSDRVKPLREVYAAVIEEAGTRSRIVALPAWPVNTALALFHKLGVSPLGPYHWRLLSQTFVFDTTRIRENLGWVPTRSNDEMLRDAYRYWEQRRPARSEALAAHRQSAKMGILRLVKWLS